VAERFELFNRPLGRLELQANNALRATAREWRVSKLALANPDGELNGTGAGSPATVAATTAPA
jgi:hypothetical protein